MAVPILSSLSLKLTRSNYNYWRPQILATARTHGLDDLLLGQIEAPEKYLQSSSELSSLQINPSYLDWIKRDQLLVSWLLSSVSEAMLGHVARCSSAAEIWNILENLFQNHSKARILQLRSQLHTQKKGTLSIDEYMLKMQEIADNLIAAGQKISDDDLIMNILEGVGAEFDVVVVNLTSRTDQFTIPEVHFALKTHEIRLQKHHASLIIPSPSANFTSYSYGGDNRGGRGGRFRGRGGGRFNKNRISCQLCRKSNHVAYKCFKRFDVSFTGPTNVQASPQLPPPQANLAASGSASPDDSEWYVDSGATTHITADLSNLQVQNDYTGTDNVTVGNGSSLPISHVGQASIPSCSSSQSLLLNNILYVPSITKNLLSISQFTKDNNVLFEFHHTHCLVKDKLTNQTLLHGMLKDGLYQLDLQHLLPFAHASSNSSSCHLTTQQQSANSMVWHHRLGHPCQKTLTSALQLVKVPFHSADLTFCNACCLGKLHQAYFPLSLSKTTAPFQLVHTDVWGPASSPSTDGFRYYVHFLDDFSHFTWIFPLLLKSDVSTIFQNFHAYVQTQFHTTIQALQSDCDPPSILSIYTSSKW